jgi:hypothetical protein
MERGLAAAAPGPLMVGVPAGDEEAATGWIGTPTLRIKVKCYTLRVCIASLHNMNFRNVEDS